MVRLTKYFALALAAALSFAACEKPEQSQDEGKTEEKPVELQIFENLVQANADGTQNAPVVGVAGMPDEA